MEFVRSPVNALFGGGGIRHVVFLILSFPSQSTWQFALRPRTSALGALSCLAFWHPCRSPRSGAPDAFHKEVGHHYGQPLFLSGYGSAHNLRLMQTKNYYPWLNNI